MSLVYSLKLLADLLFFLTFAGTISAFIGSSGNTMQNSGLISTLPLLAISTIMLGALAERGRLKYLSFIPLLPALFIAFGYGWAHVILLAPAIAYIVYYSTTLPYNIKSIGYSKVFRLYLCIVLPICLFFAINSAFFGIFLAGATGPYLLMFVTCAIVLMRMVRHDMEILMQIRFKIMNSLGVIGVIIAGALLGSPQGVQFMQALIRFIYFNIFIYLLIVVFRIVSFILFPFFTLFGFEEWDVYFPMNDGADMYGLPEPMTAYETDRGLSYIVAQIVVYAILVVVAFYVLRAMFRFLTEKNIIREGAPVIIERVFLGDNKGTRKKEPRVNHQVRQVYRKFLKLCEKRGLTLHQSLTTEEIAKVYGASARDGGAADRLREIYIESRYGEKTPSSAEIKECREIYSKMRKSQADKLNRPVEYL